MRANMTISDESAEISMQTDHQPIVFSMPGKQLKGKIYFTTFFLVGHSTTDLLEGASFKLQYTAKYGFFSRILPLSEDIQSCPIDAFVKFSNTSKNPSWISFIIKCSGVSVSGFSFANGEFDSRVYLAGSMDPPTLDNNFNGAVIKVYTYLRSPFLQLNRYFMILQPSSGPALSAGYWKDGKQAGQIQMAAFSVLDTYFTSPATISNGLIKFNTNAKVFGKYKSDLLGVIPSGKSWRNSPLSISGEFDTSTVEEFQNYTYSQVATRIALAEERLRNADAARNMSLQMLKVFEENRIRLLEAKRDADHDYQEALLRDAAATEDLLLAQDDLETANSSVLDIQSKLAAVCQLEECLAGECEIGAECLPCNSRIDFANWVNCDENVIDDKLTYRVINETTQSCTFERQCRIVTKIKGWASTIFGQTCSYSCLPRDITEEVDEAYYSAVNVSRTIPCSALPVSLSIAQRYCYNHPCNGETIQSIECIFQNIFCELAREPFYDSLNETEQALILPYLQLAEAKANHSLAVTLLAAAIAEKNLIEQELQLIEPTHTSLIQAVEISEGNYKMVEAYELPTLKLGYLLSNFSIESLLRINQIKFQTMIQGIPDPTAIFPVTISAYIPQLDQSVTVTASIDLSAPDELVKREVFNQIFPQVTKELFTSSNNRKRNAGDETVSISSVRRFQTNCATIANLKNYFYDINRTLDRVLFNSKSSSLNITDTIKDIVKSVHSPNFNTSKLNFTLLNEFDLEIDLEEQAMNTSAFAEISDKLSSILSVSDTVILSSQMDALIQWRKSLGSVSTVMGRPCFGLADCFTVSTQLVQELIEDLPNEESTKLLPLLWSARKNLKELALRTNLSLTETKSKTGLISSILSKLTANNYWCSSPPVITEHPEKEQLIDIGHNMSISCQANSSLALSYGWKRDRFLLPIHKTNTLAILTADKTDRGSYQCLATNPVGTTPSLSSTVTMFEPPTITQSPVDFTTFEGDDNGAVFICNATATPSPKYQWFWSTNKDTWTPVVNGTSNELFLSKPTSKDEGWYYCKGYTDKTSVQSLPAYLTILPVLISKLVYPVSFKLRLVDTIEFTSGDHNTTAVLVPQLPDISTEELIKEVVKSTISDGLHSTTEISDISVSVISRNVSQVSTTIFTHFHLPLNESLAEIALLTKIHHENILSDAANLNTTLQNTSTNFIAGIDVFHLDNETAPVKNILHECPPGFVLQATKFLCGKQKHCST